MTDELHESLLRVGSQEADGTVRSVERAIDILLSFAQDKATLDVPELQARTALSRPTLYRLLRTLERKGLIYSFGSPLRFQLGRRVALLANATSSPSPLLEVATSILERLWLSSRETVTLMTPISPTHRTCVFELKSPQPISFSRGTGYLEPLYKGASGKIMLAFMNAEMRGVALGLANKRQRDVFNSEVDSIRSRGVLTTRGEVIAGTVAVAAPVLSRQGEVLGSICLFGTGLRLRGNLVDSAERDVLAAAQEVSRLVTFFEVPLKT